MEEQLFLFESRERSLGARSALHRSHRAGELERVAPGVYAAVSDGTAAERHLRLMRAAQSRSAEPLLFSHRSAAVLWRLPDVEPLPTRAHVVAPPGSPKRSTTVLVRHRIVAAEVAVVNGLSVTALARTVVDAARSTTLREATAMVDAALAGLKAKAGRRAREPISRHSMLAELEAAGLGRGTAAARVAINFGDARSGSVGESCSRVAMLQAGVPLPTLQQEFRDASGRIGFTDFWWPEFGVIGEFDGDIKYESPEYLRGRTPREALLDEKRRENRLRALGPIVVRWGWKEAMSPPLLASRLRAAGVR